MLEHTHAIIIIKNQKNEYLQYYDERWDSYLFPNCKLINENHIYSIKNHLSQTLNLEFATDKIKYVMDKVHEKYSESAKKVKQYHHYFYEVYENNFDTNYDSKKFIINNINLAWLSLPELENDERIIKVNKDIIDFIKQTL